jgi:ABC-2 type transport system ATP-binding protein
MIEARGLGKRYGRRLALAPLDLRVEPGELVALLGANGAGKTTALGMLSGQLVPDEGHALLDGHDVFTAPLRARRALGYVAQDLLLPAQLTVQELAEFACAVKEVALDQRELGRLLELTALAGDANRAIGELSHGMQRKAGWVVALVSKPQALLLDEGLAGLDAASAAALTGEVATCLRSGRVAVLWTEHDLALLAPLCSRAVVLRGGEQVECLDGDRLRELGQARGYDAMLTEWTGLGRKPLADQPESGKTEPTG